MEILRAIRYVDEVSLAHTLKKTEMHEVVPFDCIFIGDDWKGNQRWVQTEKDLKEINVDVVYLPYTKGVSSTILRPLENKSIKD